MIDKIGELTYKSINAYGANIKPTVDSLKFKQEYKNRIIDCMIGEVDDNYIETPETNEPIVKLEHSKEGLVKIPTIKGKTILVDAEGNETDTSGEGCRLVSVGEEEDNKLLISSKNKNLFGNSERVNGYYWSANNTEAKHDTSYLSRAYIKVNQETYITNGNTQVLEYDKDKNFIRRVQVTNITYTPMDNVKYIRLSYYNHGIDFKGQFELGNRSTTYIEPKQHKTEILLYEPLREIDNKVFDEIVGNKIIRRVGRIVLNGSEKWISWVNNSPTHNNCYVYINNTNGGLDLKASRNNMIRSDILEKKPIYSCSNKGIWFAYESYLAMGIPIEELDLKDTSSASNNTNAIKQWLSVNNVEVLYELAEPIIEELPNSITLQGFVDTTMYIENSITPTVQYGYNALIPYKEELSKQQEEVNNNALDIEQNIIPYLMDMEFNLMLMEGE